LTGKIFNVAILSELVTAAPTGAARSSMTGDIRFSSQRFRHAPEKMRAFKNLRRAHIFEIYAVVNFPRSHTLL